MAEYKFNGIQRVKSGDEIIFGKEPTMSKMISKLLMTIIMSLSHLLYIKHKKPPIIYIRGIGKDYPRYMLYTEDADVYKAMENF